MDLTKKDVPPLILLTALWALLHHRILLNGHTFVLMDDSWFFYPVWKWGAEVVRNGWIPLWNPDAGFGTPYLADPQTLSWYLPKLLFYCFFSPTTAFTLLILGHHLWALVGFWIYARAKGCSTGAVFLGCLVFGFSFNALSLTSIAPMFLAYSWIPWVFWTAEGLRLGRRGSGLFLSIALGSQMASGYPLTAYLTLLALFLETSLMAWIERKERGNVRKQVELAGGMVLAFCGAVLFNAAWILPLTEFSPLSNLPMRLQIPTSPGWGALATWFDPFFQGHPLHSPVVLSVFSDYFCGLPALVLVLWAFFLKKMNRAPIILFVLFFVLSLGETAKIGGWLKGFLPGYEWVVRSGYWIPLVLFLMARIILGSVDRFIGRRGSGKEVWVWTIFTFLVYFSALWLGVPWSLLSFWGSLLFLILASWKGRFSEVWRMALLAAAFIFSVGPVLRGIHFTMERSFYEKPPELLSVINRPGRFYHSPVWTDEFRKLSGHGVGEAYQKPKDLLVPNWPLAFGLEEAVYSNTIFLKPLLNWSYAPLAAPKGSSGKFLDYLGIRYVMGLPVGREGRRLTNGEVPLWENASAYSRWFSVEEAIVETKWADDFKAMTSPAFDFSKTAFIGDASKTGRYQKRRVLQERMGTGRFLLEGLGRGKALLVSSEMNYPGWRALVGGRERSLERVNHHFRGVILSDGEKDVELSYLPSSFKLGAFLSLLVLGIWGCLILNFACFSLMEPRPPVRRRSGAQHG